LPDLIIDFSIIFVFFRKELCVFLPFSAKLWLRKEKMLSIRKVSAFPEQEKERMNMSSKNNNQINVPQAREAMDRFKMQAAQDEDVSSTS